MKTGYLFLKDAFKIAHLNFLLGYLVNQPLNQARSLHESTTDRVAGINLLPSSASVAACLIIKHRVRIHLQHCKFEGRILSNSKNE